MCELLFYGIIAPNRLESEAKMKAKSGFGAILLAVMVLVAGCGSEPSARQTITVMDTVATLSATGRESEAAVSESMKRLKDLEAMASPNIEGSDVCKLSAAAGTGAATKSCRAVRDITAEKTKTPVPDTRYRGFVRQSNCAIKRSC